ncbi:uncharacterized protein JCM6883_002515 [Sporobolomyces salmoneus]|uniref:uncharacterized protein n=1 Tax=Sporobolomyces salmoneus TaxID=183962 RepID=UPI00317DDFF9
MPFIPTSPPSPATDPVIYGSSTVPYSPLTGSPSSLVRNQDGQYAIATRDEIHLLTPTLPVPIPDSSSSSKGKSKSKGKGKGKARQESEPSNDELPDPLSSTAAAAATTIKKPRSRFQNWGFEKTFLKISKDKKNQLKWSDWLDDAEISTVGQVDLTWKSASFSPSGIASLGGCALATLNTNCEVWIWEPGKDARKGEWAETFDITSKIANDLINPNLPNVKVTDSTVRRQFAYLINRAQAVSIAWSGPLPTPTNGDGEKSTMGMDGSILAVGHRSGEISLWRYAKSRTHCLSRFRPASKNVNWINLIEWSKWTTSPDGGGFETNLAISDSDGRVWVQTITQSLLSTISSQPIAGEEEGGGGDVEMKPVEERERAVLEVKVEDSRCLEVFGEKDRRMVSQFCWINAEGEEGIKLAYTKVGTVNIVTLSRTSKGLSVEENQEIELELPPPEEGNGNGNGDGLWAGSTNYSTCSGLIYSSQSKTLSIHLSSGLIYRLSFTTSSSTSSSLSPDLDLTRASRQIFSQLILKPSTISQSDDPEEGEPKSVVEPTTRRGATSSKRLTKNQGPRVLGVVPLVGSLSAGGEEYGFVFESERPDLFEYHPPSTVKTHFAIVSLTGTQPTPQELLGHIDRALKEETNSIHSPPHCSLLPLLDSLSLYIDSEEFVSSLVEILSQPSPSPLQALTIAEEREVESIDTRVKTSLYGNELETLRKKLVLVQRLSIQGDLPKTLKPRIERLKTTIERELIRGVIGKFAKILSRTQGLSEIEKQYLTRLLLASSALPPPPPSNDAEFDEPLQDPEALTTIFETSSSPCPACSAFIPFGNVRTGTCLERGHVWERCSITLEVIRKVDVRTCSECHRKALSSVTMSGIGQGRGESEEMVERVNEMLGAVGCCAYCSGRWMKVR